MALTACVPSAQVSVPNDGNPEPVPFVQPETSLTAVQLVALFAETCLAAAPDGNAIIEKARRAGMAVSGVMSSEGYPSWPDADFLGARSAIDGGLFISENHLDTESGAIPLPVEHYCFIRGTVNDPRADWLSLAKAQGGVNSNWKLVDGSPVVNYSVQGKAIEASISIPEVTDKANLPTGTCGRLADCRAYSPAYLNLRVRE